MIFRFEVETISNPLLPIQVGEVNIYNYNQRG